MKKYVLKTSAGYVGTNTEEDISDWFSDDDYKIFMGEKKDTKGLFADLQEAAIQQQGFEWGIELKEEEED